MIRPSGKTTAAATYVFQLLQPRIHELTVSFDRRMLLSKRSTAVAVGEDHHRKFWSFSNQRTLDCMRLIAPETMNSHYPRPPPSSQAEVGRQSFESLLASSSRFTGFRFWRRVQRSTINARCFSGSARCMSDREVSIQFVADSAHPEQPGWNRQLWNLSAKGLARGALASYLAKRESLRSCGDREDAAWRP